MTSESVHFTDEMLLELAADSRRRSRAPYSGFTVGAACLGRSGTAYFGCNVENASYPVGLCAERAAAASAVAHGETEIIVLAVAGGLRESPPSGDLRPCGMCLQFMSELMGPEARVLVADGPDAHLEFTMTQLLPEGFKLEK